MTQNKPVSDALAEVEKVTAKPRRTACRSGLYSWVESKRLPHGRSFQKIRRELSLVRDEMIRQHGGESITPEAAILVDSIIEGLGVQKLLGLYTRKYGVIDGQAAKAGRLELSPILSRNWIGYANVVRQGILALQEISKNRKEEELPDVLTYSFKFDEAKAAAQEAAQDAPEGQSETGEGQGGMIEQKRLGLGEEPGRDP